ncbi:S22A7 protein, partial [Polypterus senegalus]
MQLPSNSGPVALQSPAMLGSSRTETWVPSPAARALTLGLNSPKASSTPLPSLAGIEWVDIKHRTLVGVFGSMAWTTGCVLLALIAYLIRDWRWLLLAVTFPLLIACVIWWFGVAFTYYGLSLNISGLGVSIYMTQFIYGAIEVPSKCFVYLILDRIGRRRCQAWTLIFTGTCIAINMFIPTASHLLIPFGLSSRQDALCSCPPLTLSRDWRPPDPWLRFGSHPSPRDLMSTNDQDAHIGDSTTKPPDFRCLSVAFCGSSLSSRHSRYLITQREQHQLKRLGVGLTPSFPTAALDRALTTRTHRLSVSLAPHASSLPVTSVLFPFLFLSDRFLSPPSTDLRFFITRGAITAVALATGAITNVGSSSPVHTVRNAHIDDCPTARYNIAPPHEVVSGAAII